MGEDLLQKGKEPAGVRVEHQNGAVAILHVGRVDHGIKDQAEGVDQEVTLRAALPATQPLRS